METLKSQPLRFLPSSDSRNLLRNTPSLNPVDKGVPTILHMVPLNEVATQIGLAHLLNMAHAHIEQVILEVAKGLSQALAFQQDMVGGQRWGEGVIAHQCTKFLPRKKGNH